LAGLDFDIILSGLVIDEPYLRAERFSAFTSPDYIGYQNPPILEVAGRITGTRTQFAERFASGAVPERSHLNRQRLVRRPDCYGYTGSGDFSARLARILHFYLSGESHSPMKFLNWSGDRRCGSLILNFERIFL